MALSGPAQSRKDPSNSQEEALPRGLCAEGTPPKPSFHFHLLSETVLHLKKQGGSEIRAKRIHCKMNERSSEIVLDTTA